MSTIVSEQLQEILAELDTNVQFDQLKKISWLLQYQYSRYNSEDFEYQRMDFSTLTKHCNEFVRAFVSYFENDTFPVDENFKLFLNNVENFFNIKPFGRKLIGILENYMEIILDPSVDFWTCYELVGSLESIFSKLDQEIRLEFFNKNPINVYKLMDILCTCGDYGFQEKILKLVFKLIPDGKCHSKLAYYFFPDDELLQRQMLTINGASLSDFRTFLNAVNTKNASVFSIMAKSVYGDTITIYPPEFYGENEEMWVDFNVKSESISIQSALKGLSSNVSANPMSHDTMFIYKTIINNINIKSTKMRQVILVHLSDEMSMNSQYSKEFTKKCRILKIVLEKSLFQQELVTTYLPKIFGGLYLGDTDTPTEMDRLRKLKTAPMYKSLSVSVNSTAVSNKTSVSAKSFGVQLQNYLKEDEESVSEIIDGNEENVPQPRNVLTSSNILEKQPNILVAEIPNEITEGIKDISIEPNTEKQSRSLIVQYTDDRSNLQTRDTQEDDLQMILPSQKSQELLKLEAKSQAVLTSSRDVMNKSLVAPDPVRSLSDEVVDNMNKLKRSLECLDIVETSKEKSAVKANFPIKQYPKKRATLCTLESISEDEEYVDVEEGSPVISNVLIAVPTSEELSEDNSLYETAPNTILVPKQKNAKSNRKSSKTTAIKDLSTSKIQSSTKMVDIIQNIELKSKFKKLDRDKILKTHQKKDQSDANMSEIKEVDVFDSLKLYEESDLRASLKLDDVKASTSKAAKIESSEKFDSSDENALSPKSNGKSESVDFLSPSLNAGNQNYKIKSNKMESSKPGFVEEDESKEISVDVTIKDASGDKSEVCEGSIEMNEDDGIEEGFDGEEEDVFEVLKRGASKLSQKSVNKKDLKNRSKKAKHLREGSEESSNKLQTTKTINRPAKITEAEVSHIPEEEYLPASKNQDAESENALIEEPKNVGMEVSCTSNDSYQNINLTEMSELLQEIKERERIDKDLEASKRSRSGTESPPIIRPRKNKMTRIIEDNESDKNSELIVIDKSEEIGKNHEGKLLRRKKKMTRIIEEDDSDENAKNEGDEEIRAVSSTRPSKGKFLKDGSDTVEGNQSDEINDEMRKKTSINKDQSDAGSTISKTGGSKTKDLGDDVSIVHKKHPKHAKKYDSGENIEEVGILKKRTNVMKKVYQRKSTYGEEDQSNEDSESIEGNEDVDSEIVKDVKIVYKRKSKHAEQIQSEHNIDDLRMKKGRVAKKASKRTKENQIEEGNNQMDLTGKATDESDYMEVTEENLPRKKSKQNIRTKDNDQISSQSSISISNIKKSRRNAKDFKIFHDHQETKNKEKLVVRLVDISEQLAEIKNKKTEVQLSENITQKSSFKGQKKKVGSVFKDSTNIIKVNNPEEMEKQLGEKAIEVSEPLINWGTEEADHSRKKRGKTTKDSTNITKKNNVKELENQDSENIIDQTIEVAEPLVKWGKEETDNSTKKRRKAKKDPANITKEKNDMELEKQDSEKPIDQTIEISEPLVKWEKEETDNSTKKRRKAKKDPANITKEKNDRELEKQDGEETIDQITEVSEPLVKWEKEETDNSTKKRRKAKKYPANITKEKNDMELEKQDSEKPIDQTIEISEPLVKWEKVETDNSTKKRRKAKKDPANITKENNDRELEKQDGEETIDQITEVSEPVVKSGKEEIQNFAKKRVKAIKGSKNKAGKDDLISEISNTDTDRRPESHASLNSKKSKKNKAAIKEDNARSDQSRDEMLDQEIHEFDLMTSDDDLKTRRSKRDEATVFKEIKKDAVSINSEFKNIDEDLNSNASLSKLLNTPLFQNEGSKRRKKKAKEDVQKTENDDEFRKPVEVKKAVSRVATKMVDALKLFSTTNGVEKEARLQKLSEEKNADLQEVPEEDECFQQRFAGSNTDLQDEELLFDKLELMDAGVEQETNYFDTDAQLPTSSLAADVEDLSINHLTVEPVEIDERTICEDQNTREIDAKRDVKVKKRATKKKNAKDLDTENNAEEKTSPQKRLPKKTTRRAANTDRIGSVNEINSLGDIGNDVSSQKLFSKKKDHKNENLIQMQKPDSNPAKDLNNSRSDVEKESIQKNKTGRASNEEEIEDTKDLNRLGSDNSLQKQIMQGGIDLEISVCKDTKPAKRITRKKKTEKDEDGLETLINTLNENSNTGNEKDTRDQRIVKDNGKNQTGIEKIPEIPENGFGNNQNKMSLTGKRVTKEFKLFQSQQKVNSKKEIETSIVLKEPEINKNDKSSNSSSDEGIFERLTQIQKNNSHSQRVHDDASQIKKQISDKPTIEHQDVTTIQADEPDNQINDPFDTLFSQKPTGEETTSKVEETIPPSNCKEIQIDDDLSIIEEGDNHSVHTKTSATTNKTQNLTVQYIDYLKNMRKKNEARIKCSQSETNVREVRSSKRKLFNPMDLSYLVQTKAGQSSTNVGNKKRTLDESNQAVDDANTTNNTENKKRQTLNPSESLAQSKRVRNDFYDISIEEPKRKRRDPYDMDPNVEKRAKLGGSTSRRAEELFKEIFGKMEKSKKGSKRTPFTTLKRRSMKTSRASKNSKSLETIGGSKFQILQDVRIGADVESFDDSSDVIRQINAFKDKLLTVFEEGVKMVHDVTSKMKRAALKKQKQTVA